MSYVTNVILHCSSTDRLLIEEVNRFFENTASRGLVDIHEPGHWYGSSKGFEAAVFVAACNHLNLQSLYEYIKKLPWRRPESLQLIVKDQEDFVFRAIQVFPEAFTIEQNQQVQDFAKPWPAPCLAALRLGGLPSMGVAEAQLGAHPEAPTVGRHSG